MQGCALSPLAFMVLLTACPRTPMISPMSTEPLVAALKASSDNRARSI